MFEYEEGVVVLVALGVADAYATYPGTFGYERYLLEFATELLLSRGLEAGEENNERCQCERGSDMEFHCRIFTKICVKLVIFS